MKIKLLQKVLRTLLTNKQRERLHDWLKQKVPEWETEQRCKEMEMGIFRKFE